MSEFHVYISGYKLVNTCFACPEQYDVFDPEGKQVAYFRLRHGTFRVDCPDAGDDTVYVAYPSGDGIFTEDERLGFLTNGVNAVIQWKLKQIFNSKEAY